MTLRGLMNLHARAILGNATNGVAESVTYRFKSGASDRTFNAVVKRFGLQASTPQTPQVAKRRAHVEIPRHATAGVVAVAAGDAIVLAMRIGEEPAECRIRDIIAQDESMFVLEVEA